MYVYVGVYVGVYLHVGVYVGVYVGMYVLWLYGPAVCHLGPHPAGPRHGAATFKKVLRKTQKGERW